MTIHPLSSESIGPAYMAIGSSVSASATWTSANRAIYIPFFLEEPIVVVKLWSFNGATAANNIDVGIYDAVGTKIVSSGSTVQSGTSTLQEFDITDTLIGSGMFYLAAAMDGVTGTVFRLSGPGTTRIMQLGMAEQNTAFALPATATFVTRSNDFTPIIGLTIRTLV